MAAPAQQALRQRRRVAGALHRTRPPAPVDQFHFGDEIAALQAVLAEPQVVRRPHGGQAAPDQHLAFMGTISLRFDTFVNVVCDVCRSVRAHGFRKIVLVNGHGGNTALLNAVASRLVEEQVYVASMTYWTPIAGELRDIAAGPLGTMSHACELETSVQALC